MAMSVYLVFGFLLVAVSRISALSPEEIKKMAKVLHDECVGETDVDEKMIDEFNTGAAVEDGKLKCYMKCLITAVPVMDEDGEIDVETAVSLIPDEYQDLAAPIIRACGTVKGVDDCDTAFQTNLCWRSKAPEHYTLP